MRYCRVRRTRAVVLSEHAVEDSSCRSFPLRKTQRKPVRLGDTELQEMSDGRFWRGCNLATQPARTRLPAVHHFLLPAEGRAMYRQLLLPFAALAVVLLGLSPAAAQKSPPKLVG